MGIVCDSDGGYNVLLTNIFSRDRDGWVVGTMTDWNTHGHGEDVRVEGGGGGGHLAGGSPHPDPA